MESTERPTLLPDMAVDLEPVGVSPASAVEKALAILNCFTTDRRTMGVSEIARCTGVPKSSAFRLLSALVDGGLVVKAGRTYSPGPRVVELAAVTALPPDGHRLRAVALPHLLDLYETTHQSVHMAVLSEGHVVCVESIYGHGARGHVPRVGSKVPVPGSALGKAILAFNRRDAVCVAPQPALNRELATIRERQIAHDTDATARGFVCVAAPLLDWSGEAIGALSVLGRTGQCHPAGTAAAIRHAAAAVAAAHRSALVTGSGNQV